MTEEIASLHIIRNYIDILNWRILLVIRLVVLLILMIIVIIIITLTDNID